MQTRRPLRVTRRLVRARTRMGIRLDRMSGGTRRGTPLGSCRRWRMSATAWWARSMTCRQPPPGTQLPTAPRIGSSPRNLQATTIGDEVRLATGGASKVYGISLKDRAAILPSGQSANAAYWIDQATGRFVTSTYYMPQLPPWVTAFNKGPAHRAGNQGRGADRHDAILFARRPDAGCQFV